MRATTITVSLALALLIGVSAQAQPKKHTSKGSLDSISDYLRKREKPFREGSHTTRRGRQDRIFHTARDWQQTLTGYRTAYQNGTQLSDGVTVRGYFVNLTQRWATITLRQRNTNFTVEIRDVPDGTRFQLWGIEQLTYEQSNERTRQRRMGAQKRDFHRGYPKARVMRYRL